MTTDSRARAAVDDLWAHTVAHPEEGLATLFVTRARRRRRAGLGLALAAAAAVVVAWWGLDSSPAPAPAPAPPPPWAQHPRADPCHTQFVTCLGGRTYVFGLAAPVRWHIPRGYAADSGAGATALMVESYSESKSSGVTVMEHVAAASRGSEAANGVVRTAQGFADWLASRPFLTASTPQHTTIDGHDAWHVRVSLRPHVPDGPGVCTGRWQCYPITYQAGAITGIWGDMVADYTAFDLPGGGTTVVWSWAFGHDTRALARNEASVAGLSWPSR